MERPTIITQLEQVVNVNPVMLLQCECHSQISKMTVSLRTPEGAIPS